MNRFSSVAVMMVLALSVVAVWPAVAQVSGAEREALIDFYHATGGDDWHVNDGWLGEEGSECDWYGVHCLGQSANDAYVSILRLPGNGLGGELPATLDSLERTWMIDLRANKISGSLPPSLANLPELDSLYLDGNRLDGLVPGELLASPGVAIDLRDNRLDGYSDPSGAPPGAISIDLSGNPISSLPPESWRDSGAVGGLTLDRTALSGEIDFGDHPWPGLVFLSMANNGITGLTGMAQGTLPDLRELSVAGNSITETWPVDGQSLPKLTVLNMTGNHLTSPPPAELFTHPSLEELHLGRNLLSGQDLAPLFAIETLRILDLRGNPLQMLPGSLPGDASPLLRLKLANAKLAGDPPEWIGDLSLRHLNLSGNRLDGEPGPWLNALDDEHWITLDLSRNLFEGPLPESLLEIDFARANLSSGPGLNLCWNRFDEPFGSEFEAFLEQVHVTGNLSDCNDRALAEIDRTISGSWYDPARSGKGYTAMLLDSGQLLYYWFGYPSRQHDGLQKWSFQLTEPDGNSARFPQALAPFGGRFGQGLGPGTMADADRREVEMVPQADGEIVITTSTRPAGRGIISGPPAPPIQERFDHQRLTELAGTTCDNQSLFQEYSGAWYNPEAAGEGFILEVLPDDRGLVYWFTYVPDGSGRQAWMIGDGHFDQVEISIGTPPPGSPQVWMDIDQLAQPVGTVLGPDFDGDEVEYIDWGSFRLEFYRDGTAHALWDSQLEEYGSGSFPIERLARPMLAECNP